jgi:hypothetical protein
MELLNQQVISRIMKYREVIRNKEKMFEEDYAEENGCLSIRQEIDLLKRIKYLTDEYKAYLSRFNLELNNRSYDEKLYALLNEMD